VTKVSSWSSSVLRLSFAGSSLLLRLIFDELSSSVLALNFKLSKIDFSRFIGSIICDEDDIRVFLVVDDIVDLESYLLLLKLVVMEYGL